jgi:hypothetical protein
MFSAVKSARRDRRIRIPVSRAQIRLDVQTAQQSIDVWTAYLHARLLVSATHPRLQFFFHFVCAWRILCTNAQKHGVQVYRSMINTLTLLLNRLLICLRKCQPKHNMLRKRELEELAQVVAKLVRQLKAFKRLAYDRREIMLRRRLAQLLCQNLNTCLILGCLGVLQVHVTDQRSKEEDVGMVPINLNQL